MQTSPGLRFSQCAVRVDANAGLSESGAPFQGDSPGRVTAPHCTTTTSATLAMAFLPERHLRSDSADEYGSSSSVTSSTGSSYQLLLDHVLTYTQGYEIPLRTMYTLNCAPRAHHRPSAGGSGTPSSTASSPISAQGGWQDDQATATFAESLMAQIARLPNQPTSLPPSFITSFVRRCFPADLVCVDFPQALTGLDYLKDLEVRRRRAVAAAMSRLAIDRTTLELDGDSLADRYPGVQQWVVDMNEKERKVEALYTQLYVAVRRWILVNEMALLPFNKHNCMAMLNTLYPPVIANNPTSKLTPAVLQGQRNGFFKYILSVEQRGPRVLTTLMDQGKQPGEENGWASVTRTLNMYLQLANSIITECGDISDVQDISPHRVRCSAESRTPRKVDSGVSFNGSESTSRPPCATSNPTSPLESLPRPKTPSGGRSGTALEKLARGLKTIGRSRTDVTEIIDVSIKDATPTPEKNKTLRKMRSLGSLESRKASTTNLMAPQAPAFDVDAMRKQRMKYEAEIAASQKFGRPPHHEM